MGQQIRRWQDERWVLIAILFSLLLSVMWTGAGVKADDEGWVGRVEAMPTSGLVGAWTVRGQTFTTTQNTEFRQEKGAFVLGACVEVKYSGQSAPFQAFKLTTKSSDDCGSDGTPTVPAPPSQTPVPGEQEAFGRIKRIPLGLIGEWLIGDTAYLTTINTEFNHEKGDFFVGACVKVHYSTASTPFVIREIAVSKWSDCNGFIPTGTVTAEPDDDDKDEAKATALIDQMPAKGLLGVWRIGGVEYEVSPGARLRQEEGPFVVGACVEVEYRQNTTPRQVRKLRTKHQHDCTDTGTPEATPTIVPTAPPVGTPGQEFELYGRVESLPTGLIGEWVVDGVTYLATAETEFEREHGAFAVGRCVKLHAINTTIPATLLEVENERGFHCTANDDDDDGEHHAHGVLFGRLQSFPSTLIGDWNVGGLTFVADSATEFKQHSGIFTLGGMIKVQFVVDANGVNRARKIETKSPHNHQGHDDDGDGIFEGDEGHAFGTIEKMPEGSLIGLWIIGGNTYSVTAETRITEPPTNFVIGARVRVKYFTDKHGDRIVSKLSTTSEDSGADDASHFTLFATVDKMPASGFAGEWVLDNLAFVANDETQFVEDHGVLGLGAYVKVEYFIREGRNIIHELETQVPPGAGDDLDVGEIESTGDGVAAAAVGGKVWKINGTSYTVTPATDLDDLQSALTVGSTAVVNSYTADDGSQVATQIRGVTLNNLTYLALIQR